jgi:hypothetical protein
MNGPTIASPDDQLVQLAHAILAAWKESEAGHQRCDELAKAAGHARQQLATQPVVALADWRRATS